MLHVGLHAGLLGRQFATPVARRIERLARRLQRFFQFGHADAHRLQFLLQFAIALSGPMSRSAVQSTTCSARRTFSRFALLLLSRSGFQLRLQLGQVRGDFRHHRLDALHRQHRTATALFQRSDVRTNLAGELRCFVAPLAQDLQAALRGLHLRF